MTSWLPKPTSKVLCRVEGDAAAIFQFTQLNHYPTFWSLDDFANPAILKVRIMDPELETIGYAWGEWIDNGVLGFHACTKLGARLPLLGSSLMAQLCQLAFWVGADEVVTNVDGHRDERLIQHLLARLGFTARPRTDGGSDYSLNLWNTNVDQEARPVRLPE